MQDFANPSIFSIFNSARALLWDMMTPTAVTIIRAHCRIQFPFVAVNPLFGSAAGLSAHDRARHSDGARLRRCAWAILPRSAYPRNWDGVPPEACRVEIALY